MNEAFRQYMDEMMTRLREKIEETQNTLRYGAVSSGGAARR